MNSREGGAEQVHVVDERAQRGMEGDGFLGQLQDGVAPEDHADVARDGPRGGVVKEPALDVGAELLIGLRVETGDVFLAGPLDGAVTGEHVADVQPGIEVLVVFGVCGVHRHDARRIGRRTSIVQLFPASA